MTDFLLELRCEEIPARMQAGARADLEKLFRKELGDAGVAVGEVTVWSTPRRLALIARNLPQQTEAVREELKGPRTSAPEQALEGFLRKTGLAKELLSERDGVWFAVAEKPGRAVKNVLAEAIPSIVRAFPWPKSMRWGAPSLATDSQRWVRPLSSIVAIFGSELVECQVGDVGGSPGKVGTGFPSGDPTTGIRSGYMTLGHRFHHPGPITIGGADDYQEKLRACHVIVDHAERQDLIRAGAARAAAEAGLALIEDEGLVIENAGLTEWPVPLLGRFDPAFLDVPPEVIQLTARANQKYFVCTGTRPETGGAGDGSEGNLRNGPVPLADAFVCTANIDSRDPAAVIDGNRKVLAARLSDARFFWDQDRKTPLAEHAKKLERITFHEKLGTVADKVERVAKLARWLVEEGIIPPRHGEGDHAKRGGGGARPDAASLDADSPLHRPTDGPPPRAGEELANLAEQAARLAKADLVTEMVGEFPELQGLMGGYYARAEGLPDEVADAIRDHYKPAGQGDEVPTAPVTVAVSLADKLYSLVGFFAVGERPTGSKDPFALRRAVLGVISIVLESGIRLSIREILDFTLALFGGAIDGRQYIFGSPDLVAKAEHERTVDQYIAFKESHRESFDADSFPRAEAKAAFGIVSECDPTEVVESLLTFFADRLKVQQREAGVRRDLIDAVFALGGEDDLVRLLARVRALQAFVGTEDGVNLLAGYKRAANILKKEDWKGLEGEIARTGEEDPLAQVDDPDLAPVIAAKMAERHEKELSYTPEPAEKELIDALDSAEPDAAAAIEAEDFAAAMRALASLRAPIDRFFDSVTVNDEDATKRAARLDLLARFRDAVHQVADFSKIEG